MGPSPLTRAQSLRVFRACYFLGEGPNIDIVPSPLPCEVQLKKLDFMPLQYHAKAKVLYAI
jgi:hypothetical protein